MIDAQRRTLRILALIFRRSRAGNCVDDPLPCYNLFAFVLMFFILILYLFSRPLSAQLVGTAWDVEGDTGFDKLCPRVA